MVTTLLDGTTWAEAVQGTGVGGRGDGGVGDGGRGVGLGGRVGVNPCVGDGVREGVGGLGVGVALGRRIGVGVARRPGVVVIAGCGVPTFDAVAVSASGGSPPLRVGVATTSGVSGLPVGVITGAGTDVVSTVAVTGGVGVGVLGLSRGRLARKTTPMAIRTKPRNRANFTFSAT